MSRRRGKVVQNEAYFVLDILEKTMDLSPQFEAPPAWQHRQVEDHRVWDDWTKTVVGELLRMPLHYEELQVVSFIS